MECFSFRRRPLLPIALMILSCAAGAMAILTFFLTSLITQMNRNRDAVARPLNGALEASRHP